MDKCFDFTDEIHKYSSEKHILRHIILYIRIKDLTWITTLINKKEIFQIFL